MKKFHLFTFLFFSFLTVSVHSQIITDTEENTTELKKKKEPIDTLKSTITEVYFGSTWMNNFRSLEINSGIFEQPLGERLNEKHLNTWAYHIGFRQYYKKPFCFEAGVSLSKNGESYSFEEADTNYNYQTTYTYLAMPIRFSFTKGNDLKIFAGIGLVPQMFIRYKQEQQWKTKLDAEISETIKSSHGYNTFILSGSITAGISYKYAKKSSIYFVPEYRHQFNSTYLKTSGYKHYSRSFGINFGLTYIF
jgi:hypothetical protein